MSDYIIDGTVIEVFKEIQVSDSFKKREIVIETPGEYPQQIKIEFTQAKCDLVNGVKNGDAVSVHININGRAWTNKKGETSYFVSLKGWKLEVLAAKNNIEPINTAPANSDDMSKDLPF